MGIYLNPGNELFRGHVNNKYYVDKSDLIEYTNTAIGDDVNKYICVSRPRRFGKSCAADMLTAYYSRECDSHALFDGLEISKSPDYETHINKFDVIRLDAARFFDECSQEENLTISQSLNKFKELVSDEIMEVYPGVSRGKGTFTDFLSTVSASAGTSFIFVIDEWDSVFRENKEDTEGQECYLKFLRNLFKGQKYVALAYMTGILPIKKYSTGSALNMFDEYTMLNPGPIKEYIGFTEDDVKKLCIGSKFTEKDIKDWYDGYNLDGAEIYNPNSVVKALKEGKLKSYWTGTEAFEDLLSYIKMNVDGLHNVILKLLGNERYVLSSYESFKNDLVNLESKNDYLIALIHLGYISYNSEDGTIKIPNHEIRMQFVDSLNCMRSSIMAKYYECSERLLDATVSADAKGVAETLGKIFSDLTKRSGYANEDSFGDFVFSSYMCANDYYDVIPEAATRWSKRADFVFYPNLLRARKGRAYLPGIIIELKNDKSAKAAADQITEKGYDDYFERRGYHGDVVHVGLNYKKTTPEERRALAEKPGAADANAAGAATPMAMDEREDAARSSEYAVGNDAGLDTKAEIVHFCEIRKYTI